jgi:hypothetical protein
VLATLLALHTALSYVDGYTTSGAMTTACLVVAAAIIRWLGDVQDMAGVVEWGKKNAKRNKLVTLMLVTMSFWRVWTSVAAGAAGSAVTGLIEIWLILPAFLVVGDWLRAWATRIWSGRRRNRGSDDPASPAETQPGGN